MKLHFVLRQHHRFLHLTLLNSCYLLQLSHTRAKKPANWVVPLLRSAFLSKLVFQYFHVQFPAPCTKPSERRCLLNSKHVRGTKIGTGPQPERGGRTCQRTCKAVNGDVQNYGTPTRRCAEA
ncbi:CBM_collapsed_G0024470.mRNA.1.CDS.1 [Saccharomyces cerevisiae]|nr:CBM_collapsed_G0024470.mRNA.1.CDS.1 [Saccharomyces cerevisiae]